MFVRKITGMGLLLLRLALTLTLVAAAHKTSSPPPNALLLWAAVAGLSLLLCLGLLTRPSAVLSAVLLIVADASLVAELAGLAALLQAAALALLGPGACSLDARWFGRRLVFAAGPQQER